MITKKELFEMVLSEAKKIKENATDQEKMHLSNSSYQLDPNNAFFCIYGLLCGYCHSERAIELLNLCAVPVSSRMHKIIKPKVKFSDDEHKRAFSAIEVYICKPYAKPANLIKFIKGEIEEKDLIL